MTSHGPLPEDWTLPAITPLTEAWFTSGRLAVQTCASCGSRQHPPEEICHRCGSVEFGATDLSPTGVIHSFTVVHHAAHPALADCVPYIIVLVALDDDPTIRVIGNLIDAHSDDLAVGRSVMCVWTECADEMGNVLIPQWTIRDADEGSAHRSNS
jgi:hypothetical protein